MQKKTKVINIFGAPGSGKSTLAFGLAYNLKIRGIECDIAHEYVKGQLYAGNPYPFHDQLYTYAKQNKMLRQMNGKVDYIITDSPSVQCVAYIEKEPEVYTKMALDYFNEYDNINVFLERTHAYQPSGRNQTEEQAEVVGDKIRNMLDKLNIKYIVLPANIALEEILKIIETENIKKIKKSAMYKALERMLKEQEEHKQEVIKNAKKWVKVTCPHCNTTYECTPNGISLHCYDYLTKDCKQLVGELSTGKIECITCGKIFKDNAEII